VEAVTYRFRGHSMADPEQYRSKEEVEQWRARDPIPAFGDLLVREGVLDEAARAQIDADALARVDAAVEFADASPLPAQQSLYEDVYVLDREVRGSYSLHTTELRRGDAEAAQDGAGEEPGEDEIAQQMTDALGLSEEAS
jgi:pyruvate dehydrogenase E1 component alpha subunit